MVYIREAHPTDGWQTESNVQENVLYAQTQSLAERSSVASACALHLKLSIPTLLDDMDNTADQLFKGWPERLYVLGTDGCVVYQGGKGPYEFYPEELETFLQTYLPAKQNAE